MSKSLLHLYAEALDPSIGLLAFEKRYIPMNIFINLQKGGTIVVMFGLMCYFNNFSLGAWVYLALHGSYGLLWLFKDLNFPDKAFQQKVGVLGSFATVIILLFYWGIGFLMMSGFGNQNPSPEKIFSCILIYVIGINLMMCSDIQKYVTLNFKKGLIDELMLEKIRNPNYLGEMMLYSSFAMLVDSIYAFLLLFSVWLTIFVSRITLKELSNSKKDGWEKYKNNSYLLLFKIYKSDLVNCVIYASFVCVVLFLYQNGGIENVIKKIKKQ